MHVDGHNVEQAVTEMVRVLSPHDLMDWQVPAGSLNWSCWMTAAHVAHDVGEPVGEREGELARAAGQVQQPTSTRRLDPIHQVLGHHHRVARPEAFVVLRRALVEIRSEAQSLIHDDLLALRSPTP